MALDSHSDSDRCANSLTTTPSKAIIRGAMTRRSCLVVRSRWFWRSALDVEPPRVWF
jgi:hypothetical protein